MRRSNAPLLTGRLQVNDGCHHLNGPQFDESIVSKEEKEMAEPYVAATQYSDLTGTASVDGFHGPFLQKLMEKANMACGYVPVGITCYLGEPSPDDQGLSESFIKFALVAVKADDWDVDKICHGARAKGTADVFGFVLDGLTVKEVLKLVKRLEIKLALRALEGVEITECSPDES